MRISSVEKNILSPAFKGYKSVKDNMGKNIYEFNFPFDENAYNCYLEIFDVNKDQKGDYFVTDILYNSESDDGSYELKNDVNTVDLLSEYFLSQDKPFAYHYKLVNKNNPNDVSFHVDAGDVIDMTNNGKDNEIYNFVVPTGSKVSRGGSMKLVIPDIFNVGWEYNKNPFDNEYIVKNENTLKKAQKSYKHFSNKIGGTLAGLEKMIDNGELDGYSSIISLPIFTDDSLSPHSYWNKNCMQISQSLGNINNYTSLQKKMFAKGMNFVSDGAFVNEGLEGVHFANVLKWGEKSPFFNWFRADGLKNGPFLLGVLGKKQDFISHKIVNSPYKYLQKDDGSIKIKANREYDKNKPTYVQIFDKRLTTEKQQNDTKNLITSYEILNTENPYEINTHDDTVINYHFEIDPEIYNKNVVNLNEYNKTSGKNVKLDSLEGTRFVNKYETFELEEKLESNFETWDANTDIAKLNFVYSHSNTESNKNLQAKEKFIQKNSVMRGYNQVQDYVITAGKYWTQKTNDILLLHISQNLKNPENSIKIKNDISKNIDAGLFPEKLKRDINIDVIENILNGTYQIDRKSSNLTLTEEIKKGIMNFPLDAIEFGDNIVGILASPFVTNRAILPEQIGLSRYELQKQGNPHLIDEYKNTYSKIENIYENSLLNFAEEIVRDVQKNLTEKMSNDNKTTKYGEYVLPIITQEIAKFAIIKALKPDVQIFVDKETGEIGYDYEELKQLSLQGLGIKGASFEDEALGLLKKIDSGIKKINASDKETLVDAISKSLVDTNAKSFELAQMIIDRTQSGLDWRIDATKDISDIDAMKDKKNDFGYIWEQVTNFWSKFNKEILKINPNAYMVAEVTDVNDFHNKYLGYLSRFKNEDITKKFLNETGITTTANYSYFFSGIIKLFGKKFEQDHPNEMITKMENLPTAIYEKMIGSENYLRTSNLQSLLYSYTFIGNHDKPRALHCFSMDMEQFFADLTDENNFRYRERAYRILNDKQYGNVSESEIKSFDFSNVSPKAIAMAEVMISGFGKTLEELAKKDDNFRNNKNEIFASISKSIKDLAGGSYLGENFNADAFGVKPFEIVIDTIVKQAQEKHNLSLDDDDINVFKNETFKNVIEPAYSKLIDAMKFLVALPGKPTLFSGDDLGATGYEEKTKNIYLQNRNYIHNEWLSDKNKIFIKDKYEELKGIMTLRSKPELDALNNGAPFTLPLQGVSNGDLKTQVSAILRQNTDGKMAISIFNTSGINHEPDAKNSVKPVYLDNNRIVLDSINNQIGLKGGLKEGAKFINADNYEDVYYVHKYGESYCIEHHDKSPIKIDNRTMILYHVPETSQVAFLGNIDFKPALSEITNKYLYAKSKMC